MEITSTIDFKHPLDFLLRPASQVSISIGFVILGIMASFWSSEITSFTLDLDSSINWPATFFWTLLSVNTVMFSMSAHIRAKSTRFYISLLRTSPGTTLLQLFEERIEEAMDLNEYTSALPDTNEENADELASVVEENIRRVLDACVNIVKILDDSNGGNSCTYRANIMQIISFSDHEVSDDMQKWLHHYGERFIHTRVPTRLKDDYSGFVYLENQSLTTTTETKDPTPDDHAKPIALPFSIADPRTQRRSEYGYPNLPGAPFAVANARVLP